MLTRVAFVGDERLVALAADHARAFADRLGLGDRHAEALGLRVDEAARFAVVHAYPGGTPGELEVTLEAVATGVHVAVRDWGLPLTSGGGELGPLPAGLAELDQLVENLRLLNLGGEGKRLSFFWPARVPGAFVVAIDEPALAIPASGREAAIEIRYGRAEDAEGIAQLLYASYGLHYLHPNFYRPRWLGPELAAGRVLSTVAVHADEVVGHEALLPMPGTPSAETGVAAVLPAYRGLGLLGRMADQTLTRAREAGFAGLFGRSVTVHPYSQRAERAHGFRECALCLAAVPSAMDPRRTADDARRRNALLILALPLETRIRRLVFPERYRERLESTYDYLSLAWTAADTSSLQSWMEPAGAPVSITREPEAGVAEVTIAGWGPATGAALRSTVRELLSEHVDVLYADVDLEAHLDVDAAVTALEELGFSYAGLWPNGASGHDHLRLQRLNSLDVELEDIVCASPEGEELRNFVLAERERILKKA